MKIAVIETHWKSISGKERTSAIDYYRSILPLEYAGKKMGWTVDIIRGLGANPSVKDYARLKEYDLVWLSYLDNSVALKYLVDTGTPYTMDFDDDLINIDPTNPVGMQYHPESQAFKTLIWAIKHSPNITVSTPHLKQVYSKLRNNITVLKNTVDLSTFDVKPKKPHDKIIIGYTGGITHYGDIFHSPFWGALNYIMGKYQGKIALKVLGMMPDLWWKDLDDFRYMGGTSDYLEYKKVLGEWISDVDIAVAPLHHTYFNKSKSWIKLMEYGANSVPILATSIDPYIEFDHKTNSIILCEGHSDWIDNLEEMILSKEKRELYAKKAVSRVSQLSIEKTWQKWAKYIESIAKKTNLGHYSEPARVESVLFSCLAFGSMTGSELYVYDLAKEYIKRGIEVGVWATHYGGDYLDEARSLGITIYKSKPKKKFDIYHAQQVEPTERVLGLGRVIQTVHSEILPDYEFPVTGVEKYIAIRPSIEAFIQRHSNQPTTVIFNGVDPNLFYRTGENNGRILFVGKDDYLRHNTIEDLKKTQKLLHFQGSYEEVAEQNRQCQKTASIMLGRTTIEGWLCGKTGIVYEVDERGEIKSKREMPPPLDLLPFTLEYMADRTLEVYEQG